MRRSLMTFGILLALVFCIVLGQNFTPFNKINWKKEVGYGGSDDSQTAFQKSLNANYRQNTAVNHEDELQRLDALVRRTAASMEDQLRFQIDGKDKARWDLQLMNFNSESQVQYNGDMNVSCKISYAAQAAEMEIKSSTGKAKIVVERQMKLDANSVKMKFDW